VDILAGLRDKLRFIERFYATASHPFAEAQAKIDAGEPPFEPPYFDPDRDCDVEPPFLAEWQEAGEGLNLVGQASLSLVQSAFKKYVDGFIRLSGNEIPAGRGNWFDRYKAFFLEAYGIDWESGPLAPSELEEINLARNDIQHSEEQFGMDRRQSPEHHARFPEGLFVDEMDKTLQHRLMGFQARICITAENLQEAVRRVETFCEFLDQNRPLF